MTQGTAWIVILSVFVVIGYGIGTHNNTAIIGAVCFIAGGIWSLYIDSQVHDQ